ncbi:MAG: LapA family protein [Halothece sp. Uz-M2-17]|nr:LapA family protein [Halothece sp. Uz-M2-17]
MRILNFVVIFTSGLALVLFSIENTDLTVIQILPGYKVQAPLSIELILAMGIGATLAWLYSIWSRLTRQISTFGQKRELKKKEKEVESLSQDVENYKMQLEEQQKRLPQAEDPSEAKS